MINGKQGFSMVKETRSQLSEEVLENERDEFYLYSLMRLLPLLDSAMRLAGQPKSEDGLDVIRVSRPERPDVDLFFDADSRLRRLSLETLDPVTNTRRRQNVKLDGEIESKGIRWFKQPRDHVGERAVLRADDLDVGRTSGAGGFEIEVGSSGS